MDRRDFVEAIFSFFNVKDEEQNLRRAYDLALSKGRDIDWDKLYMRVIQDVKSRYLPAPSFFADYFDSCKKLNINASRYNGNHIRVFFKSGRYTDFVMCGYGLTIDDIKKKSPKNDNIVEARMYPKEVDVDGKKVTVALIGDNVYPEGTKYEVVYSRAGG